MNDVHRGDGGTMDLAHLICGGSSPSRADSESSRGFRVASPQYSDAPWGPSPCHGYTGTRFAAKSTSGRPASRRRAPSSSCLSPWPLPARPQRWQGPELPVSHPPSAPIAPLSLRLGRRVGTAPPCRVGGHHVAWDTLRGFRLGVPRRVGYRADWDIVPGTMQTGIPCRVGYHTDWDTVPGGMPCRLGYRAGWAG
jgi:hypothetical protein